MNVLRYLGLFFGLGVVVRVLWVFITTRDAHEANSHVSAATLNEIRAREGQ